MISINPFNPQRSDGTPIRISFADTQLTGRLLDSATACDLVAQPPLTLTFRDHNNVEKTAPLPRKLSLDGAPAGHDPAAGEIGYWAPGGDFVLYYDNDAPYFDGIVRIGEFHGDLAAIARLPDGASAAIAVAGEESDAVSARILITGSADGLGRAAAETLLDGGHDVVVHARSAERLTAVEALIERGASGVVGELADAEQVRAVAGQVNRGGPLDAVIHNAAVMRGPHVLAVNVVAPYLLTALIDRPQRLIYLSSSMHRGGRASLTGIDWSGQRTTGSYSDSKFFVTALPMAVARLWADVCSNAVDPGWVPTRMGGAGAPDDLRLGHLTQEWLATSDDPQARTSGGYWHHQRRLEPARSVHDQRFQDQLLEELARFTGTRLV